MGEISFRDRFLKTVLKTFPGAIILPLDASVLNGVSDRIILYRDTWAILEFKRSTNATRRNNQDYYVDLFNSMSYSSFVYPENAEEVLHDLQRSFRKTTRRSTRIS